MASPIRLVIAGQVDDGKSTLIGRLLADAGQVPDDQLERLVHDSRRHGTCGADTDYALLLDGLRQEREQGITVDVAWRYFTLAGRRFIVGDAPGHGQYTRNFATAASVADAAVLLADARTGLSTQTRRHARILALFGVRHIVLAVNKLDLAEDAPAAFAAIAEDWAGLAAELTLQAAAIPVIARLGANLVHPHPSLAWHAGPTLAAWLTALHPAAADAAAPACVVIQHTARPAESVRMALGHVAAGTLRPGDALLALPGTARTRVARIAAPATDLPHAGPGTPVALVLDPPIDAPRGTVLAAAAAPPEAADQLEAELVWVGDAPLVPGRAYGFRLAAAHATARVAPPRALLCPDTGARLAAATLATNDIGTVRIALDRRVALLPFSQNRTLGGFILTHPETHATVAAGTVRFALRRTQTLAWAEQSVTPAMRAALLAQQPRVAWFTGLSGSGKSTVADLVDRRLHALGRASIILDGDNLRHGLNRDLGFTEADRIENLRRAAEVARLMADSGLFVLAAFISPFAAERAAARALIGDRFVEIHLDVPLAVAESRDPKGLYARARAGQIANFTGISSPYEPPETPELRLGPSIAPEAAADMVVRRLLEE